jgi:hypothetical protein
MRWKVYYVDGTTFSNQDGEPQDAPGLGVLAVAQEDASVGVLVHHSNDFYCFGEQIGGWYGMDYFGLAQYIEDGGCLVIKLGKVMGTHEYRALIKKIKKDPDLPDKSARYPWEDRL